MVSEKREHRPRAGSGPRDLPTGTARPPGWPPGHSRPKSGRLQPCRREPLSPGPTAPTSGRSPPLSDARVTVSPALWAEYAATTPVGEHRARVLHNIRAAPGGREQRRLRGSADTGARARHERRSHAGSREASREQRRAGGDVGRARVTQPGRPMSASPRGRPSQSEARKLVSGINGGRDRGSPGVKLKLNPVSYKEVTGGRFRLPIRNNTGFVATTEEEDSKTTSPVPKTAFPSSHAPLPQFMTKKRKGSWGALCSSRPGGSGEAGGVGR